MNLRRLFEAALSASLRLVGLRKARVGLWRDHLLAFPIFLAVLCAQSPIFDRIDTGTWSPKWILVGVVGACCAIVLSFLSPNSSLLLSGALLFLALRTISAVVQTRRISFAVVGVCALAAAIFVLKVHPPPLDWGDDPDR